MTDRFATDPDAAAGAEGDDLLLFDHDGLESLLDGTDAVTPPAAYQPLVPLVAAARRPATARELAGEAAAMAHFRRAHEAGVSGPSAPRRRRSFGVKVLVIAGSLTVASATGAAAAGGLPGPVQDTAATLLARVGINVPGGTDVPADHPGPVPTESVPPAPPGEPAADTATTPASDGPEPSADAAPASASPSDPAPMSEVSDPPTRATSSSETGPVVEPPAGASAESAPAGQHEAHVPPGATKKDPSDAKPGKPPKPEKSPKPDNPPKEPRP